MSNKKRRPLAPEYPVALPAEEPEPTGSPDEDLPADEEDDDADAEGAAPAVVIARLSDLGPVASIAGAGTQPDRVVWFLSKHDAELAGIFERYPEKPLPSGTTKAILAGLREFCLDRSDRLQVYVGTTDGIEYGFHVDATMEQVIESFEDDGFEVFEAIEAGQVVVEEGWDEP